MPHARQRGKERNISDLDVLNILEAKPSHERNRNKQKDSYELQYFNEQPQDWKYCIEGKDIDGKRIRIIITFTADLMPIITAVKFIRSYFSRSLREFGETVVHESHTTVSKWEKHEDEATNMNENTEQVLRLFIIERTLTKTKSQQSNFYKKFQNSKIFRTSNKKPVPIHIRLCA